ncbi:5-oxoprolinase subunit PxpB [Deinococcus misasensis]|uniref:5-oxoprolinase subunit PxpB n=1 Tax=Deinococcus misasensis TaxID=392413 RepID=UPI00054DB41B|nr:5-oxoprolinase subunit PxpB [Deinococcus misasensis]
MKVVQLAEQVLEIQFATFPSEQLSRQLRQLKQQLEMLQPAGFQECLPAYTTLTVFFQGEVHVMKDALTEIWKQLDQVLLPEPHIHQIPVCYAPEFALDMPEVCFHTGLKASEVIELHSSITYTVQMLGFMPGFPYLSGLDARLIVPRKNVPRLKVQAGSVGLAGQQTGIYPLDLPGGWQIIGRTSVQLFDLLRTPPMLFTAGDGIKFEPVLSL